ncbi:putative ABC-type Na+ efflux pump, permease component [Candidatus Bipolaricaulis anaerobius]|uniref:Putative ABC-type Na+ efflux pump, permease component n=1 Tax=Candidatus Bipolaricaulis anaerobius TaxID=2026885 RepID=A0A2X3KZ83_9BACT|nr:ABC transporter permease [Candidatus Bipolaricaulis anaerobius]SQD92816.1 putative ABC-type Na+ efflux pump, permease component [Candidatus Bipolaricaulis anaerobius]
MGIRNIIAKEVRELLTPQTLIPIVVVAVIFAMMGGVVGDIGEEVTQRPVIGVVDQDEGPLSQIATTVLGATARVVHSGTDVGEGLGRTEEGGGVALLVFPQDFSEKILGGEPGTIEIHWIMRGLGMMDFISSAPVEGAISAVNQAITAALLEGSIPLNPEVILNPTTRTDTTLVKGKTIAGVSPTAISNTLMSQSIMIPLLVMMLMMMAGSTVISSMGLEKESKTLETLLTMPVSRSSIVTGKIVGSALVGLVMALIYMLGFSFYMRSFQMGAIDLGQYGLALGLLDYVLVGGSLFLALLAGLALCIVLGTFARDYRSAQTLLFPITAMAMIPMFLIMFKDFATVSLGLQAVLFVIPFSHPMMAIRALMFDEYPLVLGGIAYSAVFSAVVIAVAVRIFKSDRLLTGGEKSRRAARARCRTP